MTLVGLLLLLLLEYSELMSMLDSTLPRPRDNNLHSPPTTPVAIKRGPAPSTVTAAALSSTKVEVRAVAFLYEVEVSPRVSATSTSLCGGTSELRSAGAIACSSDGTRLMQ